MNLAGILEKDNELHRAEQPARQSLPSSPNQSRPYVILGNVAMKRQQPAAAVNAYSEALSYKPDEPYLHYMLGNAYMVLRQPAMAAPGIAAQA